MKMKKNLAGMAAILLLALVGQAAASPSGLNNIPTADVAPEKTLVFQAWGTFADNADDAWTAGFKYGLCGGVEIGADQQFSEDTGELALQAKLQIPKVKSCPVQPLIGVANVTGDTDEAGDPDPYAVLTYDASWARLHLGYSFQSGNNALFGGIDVTCQVLERDLVLRGDIREVSDGEESLLGAGLLYVLPYDFVFEGWVSFPSEAGADESVTVKLNYVVSF
ncbi:hypothetical protein BVX97_05855 [bacterium E08(2017)]|nr:hypothetical protein BVX97_05855 [bacterium E08(2017)]